MNNGRNLTDFKIKEDGYYSQFRSEMLAFMPSNTKTLLDIGCSEGLFGAAAKEQLNVNTVWGVDIDEQSCSQARQHLDNVLCGDITQLISKLPEAYFDCISCNDILEHLVDPFTLLLKLKKKLSPQGVIICSVPNVRYFFILKELLLHKQWRYTDAGILDKTHLRFFTKNSLKNMFETLGYSVLTIQGINPITPWKFIWLKLLSFGYLADTQYLQFACVAKPI
ncbi:MAG: class I SAM-dependent methyltransferase [Patescibacteria group bacterium]|jgi:2-polyprenyl-3-methyl-5-hydroxy-6-metoxy-1,4-benzoquinol methylase